jgi:hypothetical protein
MVNIVQWCERVTALDDLVDYIISYILAYVEGYSRYVEG